MRKLIASVLLQTIDLTAAFALRIGAVSETGSWSGIRQESLIARRR